MSNSFLARLLGKKSGREAYALRAAKHLGASPALAARAMARDPLDGLADALTLDCGELMPHAAARLGIVGQEFQAHFKGIYLARPEPRSMIIACTSYAGKDFRIDVNTAMTSFAWHMAKLWATRVGVMETPERVREGPQISFEQTIALARTLMVAYYDGRLAQAEIIPMFELSRNQTIFAGNLCHYAERFIIAHELGHAAMRLSTARDVGELRTWAASQARRIASLTVDKRLNWPRVAQVIGWDKEAFAQSWSEEFAADLIGMNVVLAACHDDRARIYTLWAMESLFAMVDMLEQYYAKACGELYPLSTHPFSRLRKEMLRKAVQPPSDPSILEVGKMFQQMGDEIVAKA